MNFIPKTRNREHALTRDAVRPQYDATLAAPTPNAPIDVSRRSPQSKKDRVFLVQQVGRAGGESCFGCGYVVQVYRPKRAAWPLY